MGMNTNPYTITTTMGGGGGQLIHHLQRAEDEKLNVDDQKKWNLMDIDQKANFIRAGNVTWGGNIADNCDEIHIGVFGACRILLHGKYIEQSLLENLCRSVNTELSVLDDDNPLHHRVVWNTQTWDLQHQLRDAVQRINDVWNCTRVVFNSNIQTKITFVEHSLTFTHEDIKKQIKILSHLITEGGYNGFKAVRGRLDSEPEFGSDFDSDEDVEMGNY